MVRAKQIGSGEFTSAQVTRIFASSSIDAAQLATDSVNTDEIAASAVTAAKIATGAIGNGLAGGGGVALNVDVDTETGGNIQAVNVTSNGVGLDVSTIAGTGIEADGSANVRLATQGAGIAGGNGSTLSVETNTDTFAPSFTGSGAWSFTADRLQVTTSPDTANDTVNKAYADGLVSGLTWKPPVHVKELVGSATIATLNGLTPTLGDAYVAIDAGTPTAGTSDALVAGSLTEFNGTDWTEIIAGSGGFVPVGFRALASIQTALNGTIGLIDGVDDGKILEWDGLTNTPTEETTINGWAVLVTDQDGDGDSIFSNLGFTYQGTVPSGTWIQFTGAGQINAGAGLTKSGNTLNVGAGTGITVNADDVEFDATAVDGNGLTGTGSSLAVDPDTETGSNTQPVSVGANGVGVDIAAIAGTGLEADGSANLRIAAPGNGLTGGAGSALAVGAGNAITVNSNDVAVNPAGLIDGGAAEINGNLLGVDQSPSNYTRSTSGAATAVAQLAAHLQGIDDALGGGGGTANQESVATEVITGTDTVMTDLLNTTPVSNASVELHLNGVLQRQGAGFDYTIATATITWLASSGTAVDMDTNDVLIATYVS